MPVTGPPFWPCNRWQVIRRQGALLTDLNEDVGEILILLGEIVDWTVFPGLERPPAMSEQRPVADRHHRRFMCPLLKILARAVQEVLESTSIVGAESRPHHEEMRGQQYVDEIQL